MRIASLLTVAIVALLVAANTASAATFYNDSFSYPDGTLTTVSGGAWVAHAGSTQQIPVSSGKISLANGAGSREDIHRDLSAPLGPGQTLYAGFDVSATAAVSFDPPSSIAPWNNGNDFFAHMYVTSASSGWPSRIYVTHSLGSNFTFGVGDGSDVLPTAIWPSGFLFGTTHRIVTSYNYDTGLAELWVNPTSAASPKISFAAAPGQALTAFALRQGVAPVTSQFVIDNLVAATTFNEANGAVVPEPASLALVLLGSIVLAGIRRHRQL